MNQNRSGRALVWARSMIMPLMLWIPTKNFSSGDRVGICSKSFLASRFSCIATPTSVSHCGDEEKHLTTSHQDYFFIRQTNRFRTAWIALMDIEREVGGLTLAAHCCRLELLEHVGHETEYSFIFRGRKQRRVSSENITQGCLTIDYRPNDLY